MPKRLHTHGFVTVAAVSPTLHLADPAGNAVVIIQALEKAAAEGTELVVLPELCLTGYTVGDLLGHRTLGNGGI